MVSVHMLLCNHEKPVSKRRILGDGFMKVRALFALLVFLGLGAGAANAASTLGVTYYDVKEPVTYGNDFGICCSSPPATLPVIALGSVLGPDGLPVTTLAAASGGVYDQNAAHEILWWTPSTITGITYTGSGVVTLPMGENMFAPNSTGTGDGSYFETAVLSGVITGTGSAVSLSISADDDALVYLNGHYVGGLAGVHPVTSTTLNLGNLTGANTLQVFYADRAQVGAYLSLNLIGASVLATVPEPASWAMMLTGFGAIGFMLRNRRQAVAV